MLYASLQLVFFLKLSLFDYSECGQLDTQTLRKKIRLLYGEVTTVGR